MIIYVCMCMYLWLGPNRNQVELAASVDAHVSLEALGLTPAQQQMVKDRVNLCGNTIRG